MKSRTSLVVFVTLLMAVASGGGQTTCLTDNPTTGGDQTIRPFHIPIAAHGELRGD